MKLIKTIHRGELIPPFYGVAWSEYTSDSAICLPVPLNLIAALLRSLWMLLKHGWQPVYLSSRDAFHQGLQAGLRTSVQKRDELLAACKSQHKAIDALMARLIELDPTFMPSQSAAWPAVVQGNEAIAKAEGGAS